MKLPDTLVEHAAAAACAAACRRSGSGAGARTSPAPQARTALGFVPNPFAYREHEAAALAVEEDIR
jgi:hypothetical protein